MTKPGWATAIGILMIMFGGCGAFNRIGDISSDKIMDMYEEAMDEAMEDNKKRRAETSDSIKKINYEDVDSTDRRNIGMFTDTIVVDSLNNVDVEATMMQAINISDYRKKWIKIFGFIGLFIALLFIAGGIMLISSKKYTIQVVLVTLALSMTVGVLQLFVYSGDTNTGKVIGVFTNVAIVTSIVVDIVLLIVVMASDKTYFKPKQLAEDYYDSDEL